MPDVVIPELERARPSRSIFGLMGGSSHNPDAVAIEPRKQDAQGDDDMELPRRPNKGSRVAKIYKLNPQRPVRPPRMHREDDTSFDEREATEKDRGRG